MRGFGPFVFLLSSVLLATALGGCNQAPAHYESLGPPPEEIIAPVIEHHAPAATGNGLMDMTIDTLAIQRDRILTLYDHARQEAADALNKNQFPRAQSEAQYALELVDQNEKLFSGSESAALHSAARTLLDHVHSRWEQAHADLQSAGAAAAGRQDEGRQVSSAALRHQRTTALIADAHQLYDTARFQEAADLLRQATINDPQNEEAQLFLQLTNDKIVDREYAAIQHRVGREVMRQNIDSAEHLVPYADIAVYPDNWPEITRRRQ